MSFDQERLDRLLGLLASERTAGRDLRASVLQQLRVRGVLRPRAALLWKGALAASLLMGGWLGGAWWMASRESVDLGELGRRSAEWIAPSGTIDVQRAMPVRMLPRMPSAPSMAVAPWPNT